MATDLSAMTKWIPTDFVSGISMSKTLLWSLIIGVVIIFSIIIIKNKIKYTYYGLCLKRRQENFEGLPQAMMVQGRAGYFKKKSGKTVFRIKYGVAPWNIIETAQLPDPKYIVGNTVVLLQVQKDNYTQARIEIDWEGKTFKLEPIDDSLKYDAMLELSEVDRALETKKISATTIGILVMGLIIVSGIVVYYFLGKA